MSYPKICRITPEEYQEQLNDIQKSFKVFNTPNCLSAYVTGLAGETGEVCEIFKRFFREGLEPDKLTLKKELGDVIAYAVCLASFYDISFDDILLSNIEKLHSRQQNNTLEGKGSDR